ncbi:hypothetical protein Z046_30780 [Pseudomonas aeruginosa VRFPA09]|nr:hypothetical protein Z046_30780 [Pseudomonas aeruginosa VRFPA09]
MPAEHVLHQPPQRLGALRAEAAHGVFAGLLRSRVRRHAEAQRLQAFAEIVLVDQIGVHHRGSSFDGDCHRFC